MSTSELHDDGTWAWPCPYCRAVNALEAVSCGSCGAQLRDPAEDDLFTTVATDNAQVIDPAAPSYRELLWSTEAAPEDVVEAEPLDAAAAPPPPPAQGIPMPPGAATPPVSAAPFSAAPPTPRSDTPAARGDVFGAGDPVADSASDDAVFGRNPFGAPGAATAPEPAPAVSEPAAPRFASPPPASTFPTAPAGVTAEADVPGSVAPRGIRPTPDPHGLSVAVESIPTEQREARAVPIAVCGALLQDNEVVLGVLAGHLLGHPAVVVLTSSRILVANARRWKPLVDVFHAGADLAVHTRHDRDVASLTFVQGDRLTGVDDITDVAATLEMAERIRAAVSG